MQIDLSGLTIKKAHESLQNGEISCCELLSFYQANIKKREPGLHAFLEIFDDAYEQAEKVDEKIKNGQKVSMLAGIPLAIKDNMLITGKKCSAGSKMLENYTAVYDAAVIEKLKKEDLVFVGRTNMDEFAMGSSTEHSAFGLTKNPYDKERVAGGSSGGSAAAVAGQECLASLGSDTGGSIRQPAAFCGVVGMKPTYGMVSRRGLMAMASSLDQIGPFAKTVEDVEIIFNAIKGRDPADSTTVEPSIQNSKFEIKNLRIGVPMEFFPLDASGGMAGIDADVYKNTQQAIDFLKNAGCEIKEISIPSLEYSLAAYYILMPAEVSSNLSRYDGIRYGFKKGGKDLFGDYINTREGGFGREASRRILLGTYVLSAGYYDAYYTKAQKVRRLIRDDFKKVFNEVDIILSPTTPTPAFKAGERMADPVEMYMADIFTIPANLTGLPAISLPNGFCEKDGKRLPSGLQLMAPWFEEGRLFRLGKYFENNF